MSSTLPILPPEFEGEARLELCPSTSLIDGPWLPLCRWGPDEGESGCSGGCGLAAAAIPETGMAWSPKENA
jgi:hypothetical protein